MFMKVCVMSYSKRKPCTPNPNSAAVKVKMLSFIPPLYYTMTAQDFIVATCLDNLVTQKSALQSELSMDFLHW